MLVFFLSELDEHYWSHQTSQSLTLAQAQVGNQVRVTANYTDALGSSDIKSG